MGGTIVYMLYCTLIIILYGLFLAYDTQQISDPNNDYGITIDDYIVASVILYIDIIMIFIELLKCLSRAEMWFKFKVIILLFYIDVINFNVFIYINKF